MWPDPSSCSGVDGRALLRQLRARRPGLPAILMSGWSSEEVGDEAGLSFLQKPFTREELAARVREELRR